MKNFSLLLFLLRKVFMQSNTLLFPPKRPAKTQTRRLRAAVLGISLIVGLAACALYIPEKVHVKGSSTLTAQIEAPDVKLEDYLSTEEIAEQLGGSFRVYDYADPDSQIKTFLLHYGVDEWNLEVEEFSLTGDGDDGGIKGADPVALSEITEGLSGVALTYPGTISEGASGVPVNTIPPVPFAYSDSADGKTEFIEAVIGEGYITLEPPPGLNISGITHVVLNSGANGYTEEIAAASGRFNLAEAKLYPDSTIALRGALGASSSVTNPSIAVNSHIKELSSLTIAQEVNEPHSITVGYGGLSETVSKVRFTRVGAEMALDNPVSGLKFTVLHHSDDDALNGMNDAKNINGRSAEFFASDGELNLKEYPDDYTIDVTVTNASADNRITIEEVLLLDENDDRIQTMDINVRPVTIFEWTSATIPKTFPEDNDSGAFNIAELTEVLKDSVNMDNIEFDDITLYLYTGAPDTLIENTKLGVKARDGDTDLPEGDLTGGVLPLKNPGSAFPNGLEEEGTIYRETLPDPQLVNLEEKPIQLAGVFNAKPSSLSLTMEIEVSPEALAQSVTVKPDMLIKVPFRLRVETTEDQDPQNGKISLSGFLPDDEKEDLLGRKEDDDDMNEYIDMAKSIAMVIDYENTIGFDGLKVNIVTSAQTISADALQSGEGTLKISMTKEDVAYPFRPQVEILVPVESGQTYGIFEVNRGEEEGFWGFTAKVKVTVRANIDKEFSL
jgi:hypothetical protein